EIGRGVWPMLAGLCVMLGGLQWLTLLALPGLASLPLLYRCAPSLAQRRRDAAPIAWSQHAGPVMRLVAFCGVRAFITYTITLLLPLLWQQGGGGLTTGASLITVFMVVGVIGNLSGGWLAGHLGSHKLLLAAMLLAPVTAAALLGIALFATLPLTVLIAQDMLPEDRSFGSGLVIGFANALGAIAVIGIGPVIDYFGPAPAFWITALAALAACAIVPWMPRLAAEQV